MKSIKYMMAVVVITTLVSIFAYANLSTKNCVTNTDCENGYCWGPSPTEMKCHEFCGPDGAFSRKYEDVSGCCSKIGENGICYGSGINAKSLKVNCERCLSGFFSWIHMWCPSERKCKWRLPFIRCSTNEFMTSRDECSIYETSDIETENTNEINCSSYKTCKECTIHPNCGWCIGKGCMKGSKTGDEKNICATFKWIYYSYECEV